MYYILIFYFIISTGLIASTLKNNFDIKKRRESVLFNLQRDINSELVFGVLLMLIAIISLLIWYIRFNNLYSYLVENNYIKATSQLFDENFLLYVRIRFLLFEDFQGVSKIDLFHKSVNYIVISIIHLYLSLILFFRGLKRGQLSTFGLHTVHFDIPWENVINFFYNEDNKSFPNRKSSYITLTAKGIDDKIRIKISLKDKPDIDTLLQNRVKSIQSIN